MSARASIVLRLSVAFVLGAAFDPAAASAQAAADVQVRPPTVELSAEVMALDEHARSEASDVFGDSSPAERL